MLVGDPKQAMFQWNGANPKYLNLFERDFSATKISMHENYRCAAAIVDLAQKLDSTYKPEGDFPIHGAITLLSGKNEQAEAEQVLNYLENLMNTGHPDIENAIILERCAILGRNRYVFNQIETLLKQKDWSYYKQFSTQHESESALLQDFELCLRLLSNPKDKFHLNTLLQRWQLNSAILDDLPSIDCTTLIPLIELKIQNANHKAILQAIKKVGLEQDNFQFLAGIDVLQNYVEQIDNEENEFCLRDIQQWRSHWDMFLRNQSGQPTLRAFMAQIALGATQQSKQQGLGLLTVHSAKGLEFDVVIVMGMMQGVFPDYRAKGHALDEEKRNFFVAITRSKRLLCFSYAENKMMPWGGSRQQTPSQFLNEIGLI